MRIYISLPMAGHEKTVQSRYQKAVKEVKEKWPDCEVVGPDNIGSFIEDIGYNPICVRQDWTWCLGEDVKLLLGCDAIYLCQGWAWSKGCRIELAVAKANLCDVFKQDKADSKLMHMENKC